MANGGGGGYGGISDTSGGGGGGSDTLPEARVIPSVGVVVAEPYTYCRARNIAATTVPIWRAAPPTPWAGGMRGSGSPGSGEMAGTTLGFGFGAGGGMTAASAPPMSPFLGDVASASVLRPFRLQPGRAPENSQYP